MKLSQRLRELRKSKKLTLDAVAKKCGCSLQYLSQLETDKAHRPKMDLLYKLATLYTFSSDILINEAGKIPRDIYWRIVAHPHLVEKIRNMKV